MLSIKMGNSMLLIVAINLCVFQPYACMQVNLGESDSGSLLQSQLMDTNCDDDAECEQFRAGDIKQVACVDKTCICKNDTDSIMPCMPNDQKLANEIGMDCPCLIKHSICGAHNKCECKVNFAASDDKKHCVPVTSQLDEVCEIDLNCQRAEPYSLCMPNKICDCAESFTKENGTCYSNLQKIAEPCGSNAACTNITANSVCAASHCVCKPGFVASRNENKCLPVLNFMESCEEKLQCKYRLGEGGDCIDEKCSCTRGYKDNHVESGASQSVCIREISVGIDCTTPVDCILEHEEAQKSSMVCSNNTCICRSGFSLVDEKFCQEGDAVGAATQNGIISHYFVLLFATIFIYITY